MTLVVQAASDQGLKRPHNEDTFACWSSDDPRDRDRGALLVVADGMGGSRAGEVASKLAVESVLRTYREGRDGVLADLLSSIENANRTVHEASLARPELRGMGTTLTAAVVREREIYVAHVGDSRAYVVSGGGIRQVTRDHSLVAQLVESRQITPEQARTDPRRNVVTRSVGVGGSVEIDAERVEPGLQDGDTVLLCTDGLHGLVTDEELARAASGADLRRACDDLIALAKQRGGHDNITVILARVG